MLGSIFTAVLLQERCDVRMQPHPFCGSPARDETPWGEIQARCRYSVGQGPQKQLGVPSECTNPQSVFKNHLEMSMVLVFTGEERGRCFTIEYVMPVNTQLTSESTVNVLSRCRRLSDLGRREESGRPACFSRANALRLSWWCWPELTRTCSANYSSGGDDSLLESKPCGPGE